MAIDTRVKIKLSSGLPLGLPCCQSGGRESASDAASTDVSEADTNEADTTEAELTTPTSVSKPITQTPSMYRVLLVNDDFTPMDFVTHVLQKFFQKTTDEATHIMLEVHQKGAGVCGVFSHEIAETKVHIVNTYAKQHRFPLKCTMEKAQ